MVVQYVRQKQINALYIQQKTYKNYHSIREDTMTKIMATYIRNTNETFISMFRALAYSWDISFVIIMSIANTWRKMNKIYRYNQRYRMHTISISVDGEQEHKCFPEARFGPCSRKNLISKSYYQSTGLTRFTAKHCCSYFRRAKRHI